MGNMIVGALIGFIGIIIGASIATANQKRER